MRSSRSRARVSGVPLTLRLTGAVSLLVALVCTSCTHDDRSLQTDSHRVRLTTKQGARHTSRAQLSVAADVLPPSGSVRCSAADPGQPSGPPRAARRDRRGTLAVARAGYARGRHQRRRLRMARRAGRARSDHAHSDRDSVRMGVPMWLRAAISVLLWSIVDALTSRHVAVLGHLGGAAAGVPLAIPLRRVPVALGMRGGEDARASGSHRGLNRRIGGPPSRFGS